MRLPLARRTKNGSPSTLRKARTGEFTPPGMRVLAFLKRAAEREWAGVVGDSEFMGSGAQDLRSGQAIRNAERQGVGRLLPRKFPRISRPSNRQKEKAFPFRRLDLPLSNHEIVGFHPVCLGPAGRGAAYSGPGRNPQAGAEVVDR